MLISFVLLNYFLVLCVELYTHLSLQYSFRSPFSLLPDLFFEHQNLLSVVFFWIDG